MPKSPEQATCKHCGQTFTLKYRDNIFCSRSCGSLGRGGENHNHWKGGRIKMTIGYMALRIDGKYVYEHRKLMEEKLGRPLLRHEVVHHKNGDKTDNRIENLELKTISEHNREHTIEFHKRGAPPGSGFGFKPGQQAWKLRKKKPVTNASGFRGVSWRGERSKWAARIRVNSKLITVGYFPDIEDAARAYDVAAKKHFGEFAHTNFSD